MTAAAHRLWSHKAYKAKLPLRILYIIFYTMAGQVISNFINSNLLKFIRKMYILC